MTQMMIRDLECPAPKRKAWLSDPLMSPERPGSHLGDNQGMESVTWTLKQSAGSLLSHGPQDKSQTVLP